jgi:hypothetical protein
MRKLIGLIVAVAVWAVVGGGIAAAGHYDHWTENEAAEHAARVEPCAPCTQAPCPQMEERIVNRVVTTHRWAGGADEYDDSQSHPLRLLAYLISPVGYSLEWLVTRPFHEFVAQPDLEPVFGHQPHAYYGESPLGSTSSTAIRRTYIER